MHAREREVGDMIKRIGNREIIRQFSRPVGADENDSGERWLTNWLQLT